MGKFRGTAPVPVVPGNDVPVTARCAACDAGDDNGVLRIRVGELVLCLDYAACCERYREGMTPGTYAAGLRGELLGVAL